MADWTRGTLLLIGIALGISGVGLLAGALAHNVIVGAAIMIALTGAFVTLFAVVKPKEEDE